MKRAMVVLAGCVLLAACAHTPAAAPTGGLDPQARWEAGQAAYLAWNARRYGWTTTASGLQYRRIRRSPEAAPRPDPGDAVTIHYTGTFIDGREFDSSRTGPPATFPLGRLIKGWQEGVPLMRVGERFLFAVPADLAYGDDYRDPIPPGSALLFDIELIDIR
jgi:FKBP-type peptidyl-prolyl cis-trans isomerase